MTILELIKAQCGVQGVDKKHAERIEKISGITEEKDGNIIAAVKSFKENVLPAIEEAAGDGKKAELKAIEEYEKKHNLKDGKPVATEDPADPEKKEETVENKEIAELKKTIDLLNESVKTVLSSQKNASTLETVKQKLKGKIDDKFLEKYAKRVNLEADDLNAEIDLIVNEFNDDKQTFLNEAVASGGYQPISGGSAGDKSVEEWAKIMNGPKSDGEDVGVVSLGL